VIRLRVQAVRSAARRTASSRLSTPTSLPSDVVIVTSDNPRSEDPDAIIAEIMAGVEGGPGDLAAQPAGAAGDEEDLGHDVLAFHGG